MGDKERAVANAKRVGQQVDKLLEEYVALAARMTDLENAFVTYVLVPGYHLQMAVKKREYLEREYRRIRENIGRRAYSTPEEIAREVRQAVRRSEEEFSGRDLGGKDDESARSPAGVLEPPSQEQLDLSDEEKTLIAREFKRTVIPKVHADTSDAPFEEFNSVLDAYKKKDFLLMKAFIIRYGGELVPGEVEVEDDFVARVVRSTAEDEKVLEKLEARIAALKANMTAKELEDQNQVLGRLKNQNREIRKAIYKEAEELVRIQGLLEDLIRTGFTVH